MKLQRLTIHNIASIEDAVVNFDAEPLKSSEVFLITGKTGAGKSTILDAICLALFADTPRLDNTLMEGKTRDAEKEIDISNPTQLMRRNTGEAFVSLTFIGSNGVHYEAMWSVQRAHKKPTGKLQSKRWQLTNLDRDILLTKDREIEAEINAAIGLDFRQFCRTTMLAQGEFTRFLNSKDEEKAAILEKITGVDVYSKIGKKVYELTGERERIWQEAHRQVEGVRILQEEEIAGLNDKLAAFAELQKQLGGQREAVDRKCQWLAADEALTKQIAGATEAYAGAMALVQSEDFANEEIFLRQWSETIEARGWIKETTDCERVERQQQERLDSLLRTFLQLKAGALWHLEAWQSKQRELNAIRASLDLQADKVNVFQNAQAVLGHLSVIVGGRRKMKEEEAKKAETLAVVHSLREKQAAANDAYRKATDDFLKQEEKVKAIDGKLQTFELPRLRIRKDALTVAAANATQAMERLAELDAVRQRRAEAKTAMEKQAIYIKELAGQAETIKPQVHDAEIRWNTCREVYDKQRESVDRWAKGMRAKLQIGDRCPVCRQTVSALPDELEIDWLFSVADEAQKEAEKAYQELVRKQNRMEAEVASHQRVYAEAQLAFDKDESVARSEAKALEACKKCGAEGMDEKTAAALSRMLDEAHAEKQQIEEQIGRAEEIERELKASRTMLETLRKAKEAAQQAVDALDKQISDNEGKINGSMLLLQVKKEEVEQAEVKCGELVDGVLWNKDWRTETAAFATELKEAAGQFNRQQQEQEQLKTAVLEGAMRNQNMDEAMEAIGRLVPEWSTVPVTVPVQLKDVQNGLNSVRSEVKSANDQILHARERKRQAAEQLTLYLEQHPEMDYGRIGALNNYKAEEITRRNEQLAKLRQAVIEKQSALRQLQKQQQDNQAKKPEMTDEDTVLALAEEKAQLEARLNEIGEQKGAINLMLRQDAENKVRLSALLADEEAKKAEFQKWSRLNQLIGDATGNKFRKVAQSYVLGSLIHSANGYMRSLTDRYTLLVEPGTFVISIEDAYQGFARRATTTISGGESFLVSLSLALALSDIGQRLAVDTLFIDEGFGTLSGKPLQNAIQTLRSLHTKAGRHVGIISHIEELQERIGVQIKVEQEGNNSSSQIKVVVQ